MRFISRIARPGDKRRITKYLIFPRTANNGDCYETRWLEKVTMVYTYRLIKGWKLTGFEDVS